MAFSNNFSCLLFVTIYSYGFLVTTSAQKGTEVLVTWHGQVIARILPPCDTKNEALNQLKKLRSRCKIKDVISPINEDVLNARSEENSSTEY